MAVAGSEQQRLKTTLEVYAERLSIERELKKLAEDRARLAKENVGVEQKLLDAVKEKIENLEAIGKEESNVQKLILETTRLYNLASDDHKKDYETRIRQFENRLKDMNILKRIGKDQLEDIIKEVQANKKLIKLKQDQAEKAQAFFAGSHKMFALQDKSYRILKNTTNLTRTSLVLWSSVWAVLGEVWTTFKSLDKELASFRIRMGLLREDMRRLHTASLEVAADYADIGVKIEGVLLAVERLGAEFGGTMKVSKDLAISASILKAQLGVAEENTAGFLRNMAGISKTTAQANVQMTYFASALSSAAGVPLNLVMQDVAKLSENALGLVSRIPGELVKATVAARVMGTSINKMADAGAQLLNFTENVQQEMEASVLLGRSVNLQLARELTYRNDIVGATKAIVAEARRLDFENMDYFQMTAFAAATGRSKDELMKMVVAQRQLAKARTESGLKSEVAEYERLRNLRLADLNNESKQRELTVKQMANQERMAALQQQWNQLIMEATVALYPLIDGLLKITILAVKIGPAFLSIFGIVKGISMALEKWFGLGTKISAAISAAAGAGSFFAKGALKVLSIFKSIASYVGTMFAGFSRTAGLVGTVAKLFGFLSPFFKAVPVIGWVIAGLQFVYHLIKRLSGIVDVFREDGLWAAIKYGLAAVGLALYDTLLAPFYNAYKWITSWFGGNSPSKLGLTIVKGIVGIQAMIFDALTYPWRRFMAWIADKIPGMGSIAKKLRGGFQGGLQDMGVLEKKTTVKVSDDITKKISTGVQEGMAKGKSVEKKTVPNETQTETILSTDSLVKQIADGIKAGYIEVQKFEKNPPVIIDNSSKFSSEEMTKGITDGIQSGLSKTQAFEKQTFIPEIKPIKVNTANETPPVPEIKKVSMVQTDEEKEQKNQDSDTLTAILQSLNELNTNLVGGKVAVSMDGQLLSSTLDRQSRFIKGYGTNRVGV